MVGQDFSDKFLLTIHGVTSDNSGLAKLRAECESALPGILTESYFYGTVVPFRDLTEEVSQFIFRSVREKIENIVLKHIRGHSRKLYIVAHSFGTLALVRALEMHIPGAVVEEIVLLGSIVPRAHYWDGLLSGGQLRNPPFAVVRPRDRIVRFGRLVGGGESGARGFIANGIQRPTETYKNGSHTAYFPDDVSDVVTLIRDGQSCLTPVSRSQWYSSLSWWGRLLARPG